jgi:TRAP-type mannitol/chloroaromatic compound transport system permease small subunit
VASRYLVLPLSLLLFLQWPLREVVQSYSREANDLAQILFAVYVAIAVTVATRRGTHLAADLLAHRYSARTRSLLERIAAALVLVPFALLVLYFGWEPAWNSLLQLERFQETLNPGYFLIRIAALLLALFVLVEALRDLVVSRRT